jgi:hypothetical protein
MILNRGKSLENKKIDEKMAEKISEELKKNEAKKVFGANKISNIFCLHPPRGGFKKSSKLLWPKGILGKNEKINELISRMM